MPSPVNAAIAEIAGFLGSRLSVAMAVREHHGHGLSHRGGVPPDAVAFLHGVEEVSRVLQVCRRLHVPVIPFGAGTSAEDHVAAVNGGICLDLSGMDRILSVHADDLDVVVEPGVTRKRLNETLRDTGLFFPIDPGADASIGGMVATRASGTNAVRYGTMRDNVLALQVVLADGTVIRTGNRARKSAAGYDLTRLFVGSEGTLGVVTEVTLRVHGIPESIGAAVCSFASVSQAVRASIAIMQCAIPVARMELMDALQMRACNAYSRLSYPEQPCLFFEFHGSTSYVAEQAEAARAICDDNGGAGFAWAERAEDRSQLWQARHDAYFAALALRPGVQGWPTDVCVPISQLARCIEETRTDLDQAGIMAPICGHVGDGNFHALLLVRMDDAGERAQAEAANARLIERALALGGTCTGEHGIGRGKLKYMPWEHGPALAVMGRVKSALDPRGIMNPGKVIPPSVLDEIAQLIMES
ncbi:MAG TPA: FAD-linked oxidase C-terminal domain-containing protein [Vineibacter sp.]|nr:FAD-linked oxidase C-terminal domain-containing protein [Vineibacter sp.]